MGNLCLEIIQWRQVCQGIWTSLPHIAVDWIHVLCVRVLVKWYVMYKFLSLSQVSQARLRALQSWHASSWALRQFHLASEPSCSLGVFRMKNKVLSVVTTLPQQGLGMILKAALPICYFWIYTDVRVCVCAGTLVQPKTLQKTPSNHSNNCLFREGRSRSDGNLPFAFALRAVRPHRLLTRASHIESTLGEWNGTGSGTDTCANNFLILIFCLLVHCMISVQTSRSE